MPWLAGACRWCGSAASNATESCTPAIGCTPSPAAFSENSSAPNRLLVSVSARAGCRSATAALIREPTFSAPSSRE